MSTMPDMDYRKYLQLLKRKKTHFILVALAIMTASVVTSFVLPKIYKAKATVFIEKRVITELLKGLAVTPSMEESLKVLSFSFHHRSLLVKVIDDLKLNEKNDESTQERLIGSIQKNIEVIVKDKNMFFISYRDRDPVLARDVVNTMLRLFIEEKISSKREESSDATQFLSEQISTVEVKLQEAERELSSYKAAQGGVLSIDDKNLFQEINAAQQKLYDLQLRRRHLEGLRPVTKRAAQPLQNRLFMLQKRLDELLVRYTESYPEVIQVKGEMESIREDMKRKPAGEDQIADYQELDRAEAEIAAIRVTEEGLNRYIRSNQEILRKIPAARGNLEKLELEKNNKKALYDQLVARHGQSEFANQMEEQDKIPTFKVVEPAITPTTPISPNRVKIIMMGIVAGLAGGIGFLLLMDQLDKSVQSLDTLKSIGVPVLAVIPRVQDPMQMKISRKKDMGLYILSAGYLSMILLVLALELVRPALIDSLLGRI